MADERIAPSTFAAWLTPAQIVALYPDFSFEEAARFVWRRAQAGLIAVAAETIRVDDDHTAEGEPSIEHLVIVPSEILKEVAALESVEFWKTGDLEIRRPVEGAMFPRVVLTLLNVKFDPDGQSTHVGEEAVAGASSDAKRPLADAEAKRFLTVYLQHFGSDVAEAKALAAIRGAYPEHAIARDHFRELIRELRGPGKRGKPPIRD